MSNKNNEPNVLQTTPLSDSVESTVRLAPGEKVQLHVKHFHGFHATVIFPDNPKNKTQIVRIDEESHRGLLGQFSDSELVRDTGQLLDWDYTD